MESRAARVVRGFAVATFATFVAAFFHVAGGGAAPSLISLAMTLALAGLASIFLLGKRLSLWRQGAAVAVSQLLFHVLFVIGTPMSTMTVVGGSHVHAGDHLQFAQSGGAAADTAMGSMSLLPTPSMWLAHACAATLTVLAVRFGEQAFWGLLQTARLALQRIAAIGWTTAAPSAPATARSLFVSDDPLIPDLNVLFGSMRHRGPPRSGAFAL